MAVGARFIAFAATTDAPRARGFYETVLALRFVSDDAFALVFDADGVQLRIQKVAQLTPQAHTVLGWSIPDIAEAMRELSARGATFERFPGLTQDQVGVWHSPSGAKVVWLKDPAGNVISLTEPAAG